MITITDILNKITAISDNEEINEENYLESLEFGDNLEKIQRIYEIILRQYPDAELLPSFKGKFVCEKYHLESTQLENKLLVARFKLHSLSEESLDVLSATLIELSLIPVDNITRKTKWLENNLIEITLLSKERDTKNDD